MNRKGQALVEFVLILPVFILILFAIVDFGTILSKKNELENDSMDIDEEVETTINNESDYSNIIASVDNIAYIVQYCDNVYSQFQQLVAEDEQKNERLKYEFKN